MIGAMWFKRMALFVGCMYLLPIRGTAQSTGTDADAERRIHALEERLAVVEGQLEALLRERNGAASTVSNAQPSFAVPATAAPQPQRFEVPPELIPEVGKIGAETGVLLTAASNPFRLNRGGFYGGYIDLPLIDHPAWLHGKISYEILVGLSRSQTRVTATSNVAQVANLAFLSAINPSGGLQNITAAIAGTGSAPFPVTTSNRLNLRLLQVAPFSLKYASTAFDKWRIRPYGLAGLGIYVSIHDENPDPGSEGLRADASLSPAILQAVQQAFGGKSPFGSSLVAGQIGQSTELNSRGLPAGNGSIEVGLETGGGLEIRLTPTLSIAFDGRYNKISGSNGNFFTYGSRIGLHF